MCYNICYNYCVGNGGVKMPYELGGRADKSGNRYEIRVVVYYLLKVLEEKVDYFILEALGDDEQGIDILVGHHDGHKEGIQCKGRNGSKDFWDFGTANAKNIFSNWKFHLERDSTYEVSLASPLAFPMLEDLIDRSRNTSGLPNDFYYNQVLTSSKEFVGFFDNLSNALSINPNESKDLECCINYLNRIHCVHFPDAYLREILIDKISYLFIDDAKLVYDRFIAWIVDDDTRGIKITSAIINDLIENSRLKLKNLAFDRTINSRINELNKEYRGSFIPLNGGLFVRDEFVKCRAELESGKSLLIHGKAGRGKSGCTEDIINYCNEKKIQYIAIKLDKRIPTGNAERWGADLGLPTSIVHCIHSFSKDDPAVIILDQLDALRWTQTHSRDSLLVCSEIIRQTSRLNFERKHNISIVFVCRTYDVENDNNIKSLFEVENDEMSIKWENISINELSDELVQGIVGNEYERLSKKLKDLLKSPSNLYIWQRIDHGDEVREYSTTSHLVMNWWNQLIRKFVDIGLQENDLQITKEKLIEQLERLGRLYIPESLLSSNKIAIEFLHSNGFLVVQEGKISFAHQSILDSFLAEKMSEQYYCGVDMTEILGTKEKQTPGKRYQLQMLMQSLVEIESLDFINAGVRLLSAESIRYYNKYVFFEVLNQIENIERIVSDFVLEFCQDPIWGKHLINNVVQSKPQYFRILRDAGLIDTWLNNHEKRSVGISLIVSIRPNYEDRDVELIEKFAFQSEGASREFSYCFLYDINEDTDAMFELRMRLYSEFPMLADSYIDFKSMMKNCELRTIRYLAFLLENKIKNKEKSIYRQEMEFLSESSEVIIENGMEVTEVLLPFVPKETDGVHAFSDWSARYYNETIERVCINILKKANRAIISTNPMTFLNYYESFMGMGNDIFNELILDALCFFPEDLSDIVISYMCNEFERDIFDKTSGNTDELHLAKLVLEKHSKYCSEDIFNRLVREIVSYTSSEALDRFRRRIEYNRENNGQIVYWSFWGDLQYELLSVLPFERLSMKERDLMNVLKRKFENGTAMYKHYSGHGGGVSSPVSSKKLTTENWLRIITNRKLEHRNNRKWTEVPGGFIESTLEGFSRSFEDAVSKDPDKMINLVLNTTEHIEEIYINALFSGVAHSVLLNDIPAQLLENMIMKYPCDTISYRGSSLCTLIEKSEYVNWSQEILDFLKEVALNHKNPEGDKPNVTSPKDDNMRSYDMLISNAINCVRGRAAQAIGHILWTNKNCFEYFKETIDQLTNDVNPAVKLASFFALWPSYNIEKEWAAVKIIDLYEQDYRLAGFHGTKDMMFLLYSQYRERVMEIIRKCYYSDDKELVKMGAYTLVEMHILKDEFITEISNVSEMTKEQAENVLFMVMLYFDKDEYNSLAKDIISKFKTSSLDLEMPISRLFYDKLINVARDREFLVDIMSSGISRRTLHAFIHYLEEESKSLIDFSDIIISMSYHLIETISDGKDREYGLDDSLTKLVIGLYDETFGSTQVQLKEILNTCLDLWDKMFEYQIGSARRLSQEMMER